MDFFCRAVVLTIHLRFKILIGSECLDGSDWKGHGFFHHLLFCFFWEFRLNRIPNYIQTGPVENIIWGCMQFGSGQTRCGWPDFIWKWDLEWACFGFWSNSGLDSKTYTDFRVGLILGCVTWTQPRLLSCLSTYHSIYLLD